MKKLVRVLVILVILVIGWQYFGPEITNEGADTKPVFLQHEDEWAPVGEAEDGVEEAVPFVPEKPLAEVSEDVVDEALLDEVVRGEAVYVLWGNNEVRRRLADAETVYEWTTPVEVGRVGVDGTALVDWYFKIAIAPSETENASFPEELFTDRFKAQEYPAAIMTIEEGGGTTLQVLLQINGVAKRVDMPSLMIVEDDSLIVTIDASLDLEEWGITTDSSTSDFVDVHMQLVFSREE